MPGVPDRRRNIGRLVGRRRRSSPEAPVFCGGTGQGVMDSWCLFKPNQSIALWSVRQIKYIILNVSALYFLNYLDCLCCGSGSGGIAGSLSADDDAAAVDATRWN
jgi:hypothetical protein